MNRWELTNEVRDEYKPIIQNWLNMMENMTIEEFEDKTNEDMELILNDTKLVPYTLWKLLEEFGYEEEEIDDNGWEQDFWITMKRQDEKTFITGCETLVISCCGMTFSMKIHAEGLQ